MMKIYQKKNGTLEDETVLVQLERRHTLKEGANEVDSDDERRKTTRANSVGIFGEGQSSSDIEIVSEKKSGITRKPTVITESELSSSRLYKDRKAKINSDDESIEELSSTLPSENSDPLEPRALQDPNLQPVPVSSQRPRRVSSCCWYFTIVLVICIACLSVIAGVGGIIYMEYFANFKKLDTMETEEISKNVKSPSDLKEIFQHTPHEHDIHQNEPKIPEHILKDLIKNSSILPDNDASRKITERDSQAIENILRNKDLSYSNIRMKVLNEIKNSFLSISHDIEMTEHSSNAELPDVSENTHGSINDLKAATLDKVAEINPNDPNPDSSNLKPNRNIDIKDALSDENVDDVSEKMIGNERFIIEKSDSGAELSDSSKETLGFARNFDFDETTTFQSSELKVDRVKEDIQFQNLQKDNSIEQSVNILPNSNSSGHMGNSFDNKHENLFDNGKHSFHILENNSLLHVEDSFGHSVEDNSLEKTENLPHQINKSLNELNETSTDVDSDESPSEELLAADDENKNSDESAQLVFIRPIVESKAVPVPLAFLRRIGFNIKNPSSHEPMTAKDMDIKFSLAEALKYLRSLDTDNKLPVSREKNATWKISNQEKKTNLPILTERKEYLNLLRKKIFEQSFN